MRHALSGEGGSVKRLALTLCFVLSLVLSVVASAMWVNCKLDGLAMFVGIGFLYGSATFFVYSIWEPLSPRTAVGPDRQHLDRPYQRGNWGDPGATTKQSRTGHWAGPAHT
jgi:hypothetical protein